MTLRSLPNLALFLFLIFLPNQLGLHFWPSWTLVQGLRIDYLSPTLNFSYLLIAFLTLSLIFSFRQFYFKFPLNFKHRPSLIAIFTILAFSVIATHSFALAQSSFKFDQLLFFGLLTLLIYRFYQRLSWGWLGLPLALIWSSFLGLSQFITQHSQGLWILGERTFSVNTPGIALGDFFGREFLRPYSTFSHPNSLAGFLLVGILLTVSLKKHFPFWLTSLSVSISLTLIILSGSRAVISAMLFIALLISIKKFINPQLLRTFSLTSLLFIVFLSFFLPFLSSDQSLLRRAELQTFAISTWFRHPLMGVGLNNFIPILGQVLPAKDFPALSSPTLWLQPVHNTLLLILAEAGVVGLILVIVIFIRPLIGLSLQNETSLFLFFSLLAVILTGLFDHYWFSLIQNQLLVAVVLGLSWSKLG